MEASLQPKDPPSGEASALSTEQVPVTEPLINLQQSDGGCPIKPQELSLEENVMDHPSKHSPAQLHKKPSSVSNSASQHHVSETFPSKGHSKEVSAEEILIKTPSEQHHDKPSRTHESGDETCIENNVSENIPEQQHTTAAVVEHHNEENPVVYSSKHHHNILLPALEHREELIVENNTDSFTQQQHVKPSLTHDHLTVGSMERDFAESYRVEPIADTLKEADQNDIPAEQFPKDLSTDNEAVKLSTPQQQSVLAAVLSQDHEQHREDLQGVINRVAELPSLQQQMSPTSDQQLDDVSNEFKQLTQPSEDTPLDLSTELNLSVSSQYSTDVSTVNDSTPSSEQNQAEPYRQQLCIEPSLIEHNGKPPVEHTGSSVLSQQKANEGQVGVSSTENPLLETSLQTELSGKFAEEPITKEPLIANLGSQNPTRVVIDTAAPFESVKAAVSLFGERVDWKSQQRHPGLTVERRTLSELELQKAQEDLAYYKDKLAFTQASTAGVLLELKKVKRLIQNPASKQEGTDILSYKSMEAADGSKHTGTAFADKPANLKLQSILREVESVTVELISATVSKEAAVKGLQDALSSLNSVSKRVDELGGEKVSLDVAVSDAHVALADAEEQVAQLKSGQKGDLINSVPSDFMEKKSAEIKSLESKLEGSQSMVMKLKQDLFASKQTDRVGVEAAVEIEQKMVKVKLELEQAKSEELSMVAKLAKTLEESDDLKTNLEKATQERVTLSSTIESLKADEDRGRMELGSMHEKEQIACATLASLQDELHKVKESLLSARAGEARAFEANDILPASIKQAASEADAAKAAAKATKEEARKARQEIEQVKAATSTALSRQQAALKELEAAKVSEAMALADMKALKESETQGPDTDTELEGIMGVTITLEEYSALKQAGVEAEGLADKRVAEAIDYVEEAKANQSRAQSKLDDTAKEAEKGREELQRTQKQADDAQEAKLTAEADLRTWRAEHDQRRKSGVSPLDLKPGSNQSSPRKLRSEEKAFFQPVHQEKMDVVPPVARMRKVSGRDSLGQIMNLHLPTSEWHPGVGSMRIDNENVKKKPFIKRMASIVSSKKKP